MGFATHTSRRVIIKNDLAVEVSCTFIKKLMERFDLSRSIIFNKCLSSDSLKNNLAFNDSDEQWQAEISVKSLSPEGRNEKLFLHRRRRRR